VTEKSVRAADKSAGKKRAARKERTARAPVVVEIVRRAFDPWIATFEEAWVAQEDLNHSRELRGETNVSSPGDPIFQHAAAQSVIARRAEVEANSEKSGLAVLSCIQQCVNHSLVAPLWLVYAFNRRYRAALHYQVGSWDDEAAFGPPLPKGAHLKALRERRELRAFVWTKARELLQANPSMRIDKKPGGLIHAIAVAFNRSASDVEKHYYAMAAYFGRHANGKPLRTRSEKRSVGQIRAGRELQNIKFGGVD